MNSKSGIKAQLTDCSEHNKNIVNENDKSGLVALVTDWRQHPGMRYGEHINVVNDCDQFE